MQASVFGARIICDGCGRKGIRHKNGGDDGGGLLISADGVAPIWIISVSASVVFPCTIKSTKRFLLAPAHPVCVCVCVLGNRVRLN